MSETAVEIQDRELLITTEIKEKLCNKNETAKLKIIDNCEASDKVVIIENCNFGTVLDFSAVMRIQAFKKTRILLQ